MSSNLTTSANISSRGSPGYYAQEKMNNQSLGNKIFYGLLLLWFVISAYILGVSFGRMEALREKPELLEFCITAAKHRTPTDETVFQYVLNTCFPYLLSAITIYMNVLAGQKRAHAWAVGLVGQIGWTTWIVMSSNWGFLPMNVALWIVYTKNHLRWSKPENK